MKISSRYIVVEGSSKAETVVPLNTSGGVSVHKYEIAVKSVTIPNPYIRISRSNCLLHLSSDADQSQSVVFTIPVGDYTLQALVRKINELARQNVESNTSVSSLVFSIKDDGAIKFDITTTSDLWNPVLPSRSFNSTVSQFGMVWDTLGILTQENTKKATTKISS